jgi:carboxyl-terminal processing protease
MQQRRDCTFIVRSFHSCRALGLVAALLVSCWCADLHSVAGAELDRAKLFDSVVETVERKFFDQKLLKQIDWRARADAVRPAVLAAPTTDDAVRQINALLAEFKTSHTGLFTPDDYFYAMVLDVIGVHDTDLMARRFWGAGPYYPGTGAFTRIVDGRHFVDAVLEGSPADRAGLRYGDEVVAVDGMPYNPVAAFRGKVGTTTTLTIRRHAGVEPQQMPVEVVPVHPVKAFGEATVASARVIERGGKRIGYVHIWASAEEASFKKALSRLDPQNIALERLAGTGVKLNPGEYRRIFEEGRQRSNVAASTPTPNVRIVMQAPTVPVEMPRPIDFLIVDMRGKIGGNIVVAHQLLATLDVQSYWGGDVSRGRPGDFSGMVLPSTTYRGRVALLINGDTRSAGEIMAYGFKRSGFGPVLGTNTAGAVSSGSTFAMPGDLLLYVAVSSHEVDGRRLEGVGVAPDHLVERPLPYAAGADPVLEAALDLLAAQPPKE